MSISCLSNAYSPLKLMLGKPGSAIVVIPFFLINSVIKPRPLM